MIKFVRKESLILSRKKMIESEYPSKVPNVFQKHFFFPKNLAIFEK
jgi:hypothetical protein